MGRLVKVMVAVDSVTSPWPCLLDPIFLKTFHGHGTDIGSWCGDTRILRVPLDTSGSPLSLGSNVYAHVIQRFDGHSIRNTLTLEGFGDLLCIDSRWYVHENQLTGEALCHVNLPQPLRWIAEMFVVSRAQKQMNDFLLTFKNCKRSH